MGKSLLNKLPSYLFLFFVCFLIIINCHGNNLKIENLEIGNRDNTAKTIEIEFDLSWENAFRIGTGDSTEDNWDAAWIFIKWKRSAITAGPWHHGILNEGGHSLPSGFTYSQPDDNVGLFIFLSGPGNGDAIATGVKIVWNYGENGISAFEEVDIQVFGIEMVFVPEGSFYLGSGGNEGGSFTDGTWTEGNSIPFLVTSENGIPVGPEPGKLWNLSSSSEVADIGNIASQGIPQQFPKGYRAIYAMKYEITQKQYVDFLNSLTREQQNYRTNTDVSSGITSVENYFVITEENFPRQRNSIRCNSSISANGPINFYCDLNNNGLGNEPDDGMFTALSHITYLNFSAYLDWAGLRPMTEIEYEKITRGKGFPIPLERAWGTAEIHLESYEFADLGTKDERIIGNYGPNNSGNSVGIQSITPTINRGPLRTGIFATPTSTRQESGSSYWGIMDLTGNVDEIIIPASFEQTIQFSGTHGDGILSQNGFANNSDWPGYVDGEVTSPLFFGLKGGSVFQTTSQYNQPSIDRTMISSRNAVAFNPQQFDIPAFQKGLGSWGGRGVRTAP